MTSEIDMASFCVNRKKSMNELLFIMKQKKTEFHWMWMVVNVQPPSTIDHKRLHIFQGQRMSNISERHLFKKY